MLSRREVLRKKEHLETAVLSNIGGLLKDEGNYPEAEGYLRECVEIRRRTLGARHPRLALALGKLGNVLYSQGRYKEAEEAIRESLNIRVQVLGENGGDVAPACSGLGAVLADLGWSEAESMIERAVAIRERTLGLNDLDHAVDFIRLARFREARGDRTASDRLFGRALEIRKARLRSDHPLFARWYNAKAVMSLRRRDVEARGAGLERGWRSAGS